MSYELQIWFIESDVNEYPDRHIALPPDWAPTCETVSEFVKETTKDGGVFAIQDAETWTFYIIPWDSINHIEIVEKQPEED